MVKAKKKRGRPRKNQLPPEVKLPMSPQIIPPEKPEENLGQKLKKLLLPAAPPVSSQQQPQSPSQTADSSATSAPESSSEFHDTAEEIAEKYAASDTGGGTAGDASAGSGAAPGAQAPNNPVVNAEMVEAFFVAMTESLAKNHGNHWRMTHEEKIFIVPVNVAMLNEQIPKLFGNLDNPALWAWCLVMAGWIGTKSEKVGKVVEAGIGKIISIFSGNNGKVPS